MLDLKFIISNLEEVKEKTKARNYSFDFDSLIEKDVLRKLKARRCGIKDFKNNKFGKFDYDL